MNSSRRDFLLRTGLVSLGGSGLLLSACGGGGGGTGGGGTVQLSQDVNGRVVIEAWVQLPPADIERIKREYMAEVVSRGLGINDEKSCLTMPPRPYSGVWVRLGKTTVMTDEEGRFTLPAGSSGSVIEVLRQPTSNEVELSVALGLELKQGVRAGMVESSGTLGLLIHPKIHLRALPHMLEAHVGSLLNRESAQTKAMS
jgi:hypothetical protein